MVGPTPAKSHEECLKSVCAVCTGLNGQRAQRPIKPHEVLIVQKYIYTKYEHGSLECPQGMCKQCAVDLSKLNKQEGKGVKLNLPEDYLCKIPTQTRSKVAEKCSCRWCGYARLNGLQFKLWQSKMKETHTSKPSYTYICQNCRKGVQQSTLKHTCTSTDQERIQALVNSIPQEVKGKLTLALLQEQQAEYGSGPSETVSLPQARGGKPVVLQVGPTQSKTEKVSLTLEDWEVAGAKAHLSGKQKKSLAADLCATLGRRVIEPGRKRALPLHNKKFEEYFTSEKRMFKGKAGLEETVLFFCHSPQLFLDALDQARGKVGVPQATLVQGDSGQAYTKLCVSRLDLADLEQDQYTRLPGPGLVFMETEQVEGPCRKRRRTREEGVQGGEQFCDPGVHPASGGKLLR